MRLPTARATGGIVIVTGIAWLAAHTSGLDDRVAQLAGFISARLSLGLNLPDAVPAVLTPLSATLVHGGLLHLVFNLLMIGFCGRYVEASIGWVGFLLLYVLGAYAAAGAQYLSSPDSLIPMVGASGAGSAVVGAYALLFGERRVADWGPVPGRLIQVVWLAVAWIGMQALIGLSSSTIPGVPANGSVATAAHIGGFLAGLLLARPLLALRYRSV